MSFRKLLLAGATVFASTAAFTTSSTASVIDRPHFKVLGVAVVWSGDGSGGAVANDFVIGVGTNGTDLINGDNTAVLTGTLDLTNDSAVAGSTLGDVLTVDGVTGDQTFSDLSTAGSMSAFDPEDYAITGEALVYNSSFFVASNTAFDVVASTSVTEEPTDTNSPFHSSNVGYGLSMTTSGATNFVDDDLNPATPDVNIGDEINFGSASYNTVSTVGTFNAAVTSFDQVDGATLFTGSGKTAESNGSIADQSVRFDASYTVAGGAAYDMSMGAGEFDATVTYTVYVP
ncbi:MAG: hypothetical protein AAGF20_08285 [Pseudomonadota bacterium]